MQIFVHDIVAGGSLRRPDAEMQQLASVAAAGMAQVPNLTFAGVRLFVERVHGEDQGLLVVENAKFRDKEFPTAAEMDQLECVIRAGILSQQGVQSIGAVRFHSLTALVT